MLDPQVLIPPLVPPGGRDRPDGQPVVGETARQVALVATREARARTPRADAAGVLDAPSAELMRLLGQLRSTVIRHVRNRRGAGVPVERALSEVKGLVREASALERWVDPADTLTAQVVRWTIVAYYDEPELARVQLAQGYAPV